MSCRTVATVRSLVDGDVNKRLIHCNKQQATGNSLYRLLCHSSILPTVPVLCCLVSTFTYCYRYDFSSNHNSHRQQDPLLFVWDTNSTKCCQSVFDLFGATIQSPGSTATWSGQCPTQHHLSMSSMSTYGSYTQALRTRGTRITGTVGSLSETYFRPTE